MSKGPSDKRPGDESDERHGAKVTAYNHFVKQHDELNSALLDVSGRYDQWILALSGGALGISLGFLEKIAPNPSTSSLPFLALAWLSFVAAVWAGLSAIFCSQYSIQQELENERLGYESLESVEAPPALENCYTGRTNRFNFISIIAFTFGLISFCVFAFLNIHPRASNQTKAVITAQPDRK